MRPLRVEDVEGSHQEYLRDPGSAAGQEILMDARARVRHFLKIQGVYSPQLLAGEYTPSGYLDPLFLEDLRVVMDAAAEA